ncbi:ArsR/SmtB family transcription factor [Pseudonocardia kunmingensis]|uniref:DNA-binding transcriptional ArsR family regulator n=1 Tax=Pseudonocardia kunmingensis TaxID=630975 RepID=A0A543DZ93_9PSEU|nr:metalloregulator ArsR/SmtB family transcription factor [Pseudonocardia kunmingensis]TQM14657.1 DNA-binding transcriptional ArsR family regulator [Pseudonocardia kunmingensis]
MQTLSHPTREQIRFESVLDALAHPVRLRVVRRLADGEELTCGTTLPDVPKSAASHHWRILRESGVLHARREGRTILHTLRREDLDARFPGLLEVVRNAVDADV